MKLAINEPCHEDWDAMKIGLISRHCGVCEKNVMDFTNSSRAEIITYILSNREGTTCGRMRRDQFEFHHEDIPVLVEVLRQKPRNHAFLILALVSLSLSACAQEGTTNGNNGTGTGYEKMGIIAQPPEPKMGKIKPVETPDTTKAVCEPIENISKGEIMLQGDIAVEPNKTKSNSDNKILPFAEKMPEYSTGIDGLFSYIKGYFANKRITSKGTAYVRFVVNEDGRISDPEIIKMDAQLEFLRKDILQMLVKMPNWIPGENEGKKVKVYYTIPVRFD